jgi:ubiquinone/menaquinone biosynthesis C-methylase UbiE
MHKFNPEHIEKLIGEQRRRDFPPEEFLRAEGLKEGERLADVGCGPGFLTLAASKIVGPAGRVYAIDTQAEMLEELKKGIFSDNVIPVLSEESEVPLDDSTVDMVLVVHVIHEAEDRGKFLAEVKRLLVPGGRLVIVDWKKQAEEKGPPVEERVPEEEAARLVEEAGFGGVIASSISESHYKITASKAA